MSDEPLLNERPTLARRLNGFSVTLFGLAYICPTVVISTFGLLMTATHGEPYWAYAIATAAMLCTAASYARLSRIYTDAGSAFSYVTNTIGPGAGFLTGWVLVLDYFFVPMVICLFTAKGIELLVPGVSYRVWVAVIASATTAVNVLGITIADRVNMTIMAAQFVVIAIIVVLCAGTLQTGAPIAPMSASSPPATVAMLMTGAAIAAYSFLGFDSVTTLAEEALQPTTSVPRAVILVAGLSGAIYVVTSYLLAKVHPGLNFGDVDNAGYEVLNALSPSGFIPVVGIIMVAYGASVMCAQAGSSRLLYAMARAGCLPRRLGSISSRFRTPVFNICLTGVFMLSAEFLDVDTASACVNFGAFCAFMAVDVCILWDHATQRRLPGGLVKLTVAAAGIIAMLWLIASLHRAALILGSCWLIVGLLYATMRRGSRTQTVT